MKTEYFETSRENILLVAIFIISLTAGSSLNNSYDSFKPDIDKEDIAKGIESQVISITEQTQSAARDIYGRLYATLRETRRYNGSQENFVKVEKENPSADLERIYRSDIDVVKNVRGLPPFRVDTNSKGLRGENFNMTSPENTTRILVLGDSYVYGSGVNRSDRYTNLLEKRLNQNSEKNYQVINAGIFGAGAKDYYLFLKHKGLNYDPDMVIVSVIGNDWMPLEMEKRISRNASVYVDRNYPNASEARKGKLTSERFLDLQAKNQDLERYSILRNLSALAAKNGIDTLVYASDYMAKEKMDKVRKYGDTENSTLIKAPQEFRDDWRSEFCLRYSPNRVSMTDRHPSPEGHRILADRLYREIKGNKEPLLPWSYGGFDQWIDPC